MASISVLLPVSGSTEPNSLNRAYQSVLEQSVPPTEVIIVTNQPLPRKLEKTIEDLISTHSSSRHEHVPDAHGLGGVLQAGLKRCSEPLVARMDADDIAVPERFAKQQAILTESEVDIVGAQLAEFRDNPDNLVQTREVPITHNEIAEWMAWRCPLNHPTTMFNREAVLEAGGYRDFPLMEDWDLWARCLAAGLRFRNLDQILVRAQTDDLVSRRGGVDYAHAEIQMAQQLRELSIASRWDTLRHLCLRIPPRLLPQLLRKTIYRLFAR